MNSDDIKDLCVPALFLLFGLGMLYFLPLPNNSEKSVEPKRKPKVILQPRFLPGPNGKLESYLVPVLH